MKTEKCYCGSTSSFVSCCQIYINGNKKAPTALVLMKSRYSAYATLQVDYLLKSTHLSQRYLYSKEDLQHWARANNWQKLEIISFAENTVEFKAYFIDENKISQTHHELSTFILEDGIWYYVDGEYFN